MSQVLTVFSKSMHSLIPAHSGTFLGAMFIQALGLASMRS